MSKELELKSVPEVQDTAREVLRESRIILEKILGTTPEEIQEMHKILAGFNSMEIRDALRTYRRGHDRSSGSTTDRDMDMRIITGGLTTMQVKEAVRHYKLKHPE